MKRLRSYLLQGDISDLNLFKLPGIREKYDITLAVNVGSTNFVPPDMYAVHLPMMDDSLPQQNDWPKVIRLLYFVVDEIHHGGKVLIACDAGLSRSIVLCGMLISVIEHRPMDSGLMRELGGDPLLALWEHGANAIATWWMWIP